MLGPQEPAEVEQHAAADDGGCRVLDARDEVAVARDHGSGRPAVPGHAAVEDVAEAVPLRRALQRHGDDVVGAAEAVREALRAALRHPCRCRASCAPGWCGGASPAAGRSCRTAARARSSRRGARGSPRCDALGVVDEVERAEPVVVAPAAPVAERLGGLGDVAVGVGAVELARVARSACAGSDAAAGVLIALRLGDGPHGLRAEPLDRADHHVAVAQHPAVHDAVAGGAAREEQVARAAAACSARRRR